MVVSHTPCTPNPLSSQRQGDSQQRGLVLLEPLGLEEVLPLIA